MELKGTALYNTFFHNADPNKIKSVLSRIAAGDNIAFRGVLQPPLIICDNPTVPAVVRSAAHAACQHDPGAHALWMEDTHGVFLCQTYFQNKRVVPSEKQCVGWNRLSTGMLLGETQWTILFHELVHLYLGVPSLVPEVRGIFDVQELGSEDAVRNPASYGFFLASMTVFSLILVTWMIRDGSRMLTLYQISKPDVKSFGQKGRCVLMAANCPITRHLMLI